MPSQVACNLQLSGVDYRLCLPPSPQSTGQNLLPDWEPRKLKRHLGSPQSGDGQERSSWGTLGSPVTPPHHHHTSTLLSLSCFRVVLSCFCVPSFLALSCHCLDPRPSCGAAKVSRMGPSRCCWTSLRTCRSRAPTPCAETALHHLPVPTRRTECWRSGQPWPERPLTRLEAKAGPQATARQAVVTDGGWGPRRGPRLPGRALEGPRRPPEISAPSLGLMLALPSLPIWPVGQN